MKFIVRELPLDTYEVRLHPDTKVKIIKIAKVAYWGMVGVAAVKLVSNMLNDNEETTEED